ncbi:zinc finger CCCH domain-containing 25 [Olea europaea subsp. europaea]|uniref:Zinc finger CCCH domain-containing 25 n=1 Tax=Olea europaea subsp. europaea TaxID=158383 RepID=A0A8S0SRJ1_OLEEU|nr:zinc finger CCCH domain-containing 25 [Olea europaea subsp. europaea]
MNPLTLVKRIQNINKKEATLGISEEASWHAKYKESAYVYVGGIPFDLTEGDLLAVFAQYGEVVDVNLVRDKGTGKSKGFAFLAYEDQRSTNLAVDNLNGAQILGRTIRVDHVSNYKKKEEEDEETEQKKREERGICRAFQRGECNRGDGCKFSHDEQRAANTGWGAEEDRQSRWVRDKFEGSARGGRRSDQSSRVPESVTQRGHRYTDKDSHNSPAKFGDTDRKRSSERIESNAKDLDRRGFEKHRENVTKHKDDWDKTDSDKRSRRNDDEPKSRRDYDRGDEMRSRRYESESYHKEDRYGRRGDGGSARDSSHHHQRTDEERQHQSRRR